MELNIGTNIKRLRLAKGLTQEQLADLLNISTAAISKWEAGNTYPDITLLFPIAGIFGVSVDELLGYDEVKAKEDITKLLEDYRKLKRNGHFTQASAILAEAKKKYPHDYHIMSAYMWDKSRDNLLANKEEFTNICNCILNGCTDETLRLEALNMKAKLLHVQNNTESALKILSQLPGWFGSAEQKKEELFAKDTDEYRYWNKRNYLGLMDAMANKLARTVWYDNTLSLKEKVTQLEAMGDAVAGLCIHKGLESFYIIAQMIYAELAGKLSTDGDIQDIIRIRKKQFAAMKQITALAESDSVLKESLLRTYKTADILDWQVKWLQNSAHSQFARLRENPEYMDMLNPWS